MCLRRRTLAKLQALGLKSLCDAGRESYAATVLVLFLLRLSCVLFCNRGLGFGCGARDEGRKEESSTHRRKEGVKKGTATFQTLSSCAYLALCA